MIRLPWFVRFNIRRKETNKRDAFDEKKDETDLIQKDKEGLIAVPEDVTIFLDVWESTNSRRISLI